MFFFFFFFGICRHIPGEGFWGPSGEDEVDLLGSGELCF